MVLCAVSRLPTGQCPNRSSCETEHVTPERPGLVTRWHRLPYEGASVPSLSLGWHGQENVSGRTLPSGCTLHNADTTEGRRESVRDHSRRSWSPDCARGDTYHRHDYNGDRHSQTGSPHARTTCHQESEARLLSDCAPLSSAGADTRRADH